MASGLVKFLSGAGFSAPECYYKLKEGIEYRDSLPLSVMNRIDEVFNATITHKNQFGHDCFTSTIKKWNDFFLSIGIKEMFCYGSFSRQLLDRGKEFSQEYIEDQLEVREDKAADMDFLAVCPGADKKERAEKLSKILEWALSLMYPNGDSPPNEIHRLQRQLFVNLSNKDGKGRYAHLKFLIFSLNSSIRLNGRDHPLKMDFVISGNSYPLLFNIDQFRFSVTKYLTKERVAPFLKEGLQDILSLNRRRLIPNQEINYDELSFIKLLNRRIQGFYLPFSEDGKFFEVVFDSNLHRNIKRKLTLEQIQKKALDKYLNCSISLTLFAFQLRLFLKKDLIVIAKLEPIRNPSTWQEKLVNWMQVQLYNPALLDKIPTLTFLLLIKMISGEPHLRIYEEALRIRFQIQKVTVFLFLPLNKLEISSHYLKEIKEVLNIVDEKEALNAFLLSQMVIKDKEAFQQLFELVQKEAPSLFRTLKGSVWILKAFQMGWTSKETALNYAHDSDEYFNALEQDPGGLGRRYLLKFPNTARALAYYSERPFQTDVLCKSVSAGEDIDAILVKLKWNYEEVLKRLRCQPDFYLRFDPDYSRQTIEELVFRRSILDLPEFIAYYLSEFRDETSERLAVLLEPEAYLEDVERVIDFLRSFPYPVPIKIICYAISLILSSENKGSQIDALHDLYLNLGGKRGEAVPFIRVFDDSTKNQHALYKIAPEDNGHFYVRYYYEVCIQLLSHHRPLADYDYIINQLMLILPDLREDEIKAAIDKWLVVRHENKEALINHYTTSLARLANYMEKTLSKSKKLKRLQERMSIIAGIYEAHKRCPMDLFREAIDPFSLDDPSTLEQALFILSNAPLNIRESLSVDYCNHVFEKAFKGIKEFDNRCNIVESLIYVLIGNFEKKNNTHLFHSSKKMLIEKILTVYAFIIEFCSKEEVDKESFNIFVSGVRLMQLLKDNHLLTLDENPHYRNKAEEFIFESPKFIQSPLSQIDLRGSMNYIYKGTSLEFKFLYETSNFFQRYCNLI